MIRPLAALALALTPSVMLAQTAPVPAPPKLLVVIAVDQFSADLFAEYRSRFRGGLRKLSQGAVFPSGYQSHAATETCPGHSTILTGARPSRSGVIANSWIDQRSGRATPGVYCAEDVTKGPSSKSGEYVPSPAHLLVPTLGDRMKTANPASRIVSVAGKDRAAIMMGGRRTDEIWFLRPTDYVRFESLAGRTRVPRAVVQQNAAIDAALATVQAPRPLGDCADRSRAVAIGTNKTIGTGSFARAAGDKRAFRASPEPDVATIQLAGDLVDEMKLGRGRATDLIAVGLAATDFVGHTYGTNGSEMCLQLMAVDTMLGTFFSRLDQAGIDYVVALTADHGGHDATERNDENALPDADRALPELAADAVGLAVAREMGLTKSVLLGDDTAGDMWLDAALTAEQRALALAAAVARYRAHPQVAAVFTAAEIEAASAPSGPPENWGLIQRAKASYFRGRSGDFLVALKPRVMPIPASIAENSTYVATHGSIWDYDRRVPIVFWRKGMAGFEQPNGVETVDIAPTLASLIGMTMAQSEIDGRCLDLIAGPASSCR